MSSSFRDSVHTASEYDPYYDYMEPNQMDNTRSPALNSPPMSDTDTSAHRTQLSFRSSVGLLPTPGTVSKRHPKYVRHASIGAKSRMLAHLKIT